MRCSGVLKGPHLRSVWIGPQCWLSPVLVLSLPARTAHLPASLLPSLSPPPLPPQLPVGCVCLRWLRPHLPSASLASRPEMDAGAVQCSAVQCAVYPLLCHWHH